MKKLFITVLIIILITPSAVFSIERINKSPDEVLSECKNYIDTIKQSRYIMYNVLSLTDGQIEQYDKVILQNNPQYQKIFDELISETYILCTMEKVNSSLKEKSCIKRRITHLKKELKVLLKNENNSLRRILTREQREIYTTVRHLERHDLKSELCPKDYYKTNPKLEPFGGLRPCEEGK